MVEERDTNIKLRDGVCVCVLCCPKQADSVKQNSKHNTETETKESNKNVESHFPKIYNNKMLPMFWFQF
jgi:hypothetical protein